MIDESLLKLLVCPQSKAPLKQVEDELICEQSELAYFWHFHKCDE
jgi:uncharacterized protein YbaR (Trm112 family)